MAGYRLIAEAQRELRTGVSFYERQYPGLGKDFVLEVRRLCRRIVETPCLGTEVRSGVRRRLVRRFPYAVLMQLKIQRSLYWLLPTKADALVTGRPAHRYLPMLFGLLCLVLTLSTQEYG